MSALQIVLYSVVAALVLLFLAGSVTSLVATKLRKPFVERAGGDIAFISFVLALPSAVAAVTDDMRVLGAGGLVALLMIVVMFVVSPRCARCRERFNPLTNRQFRQPLCLFCGAPERR